MNWKNNPLTAIANTRPVIFYVTATYLWTWTFWISALYVFTEPQGLRLALFLTGGFGPALAGVLTIRLRAGNRDAGAMKLAGFLVGAALAIAALLMFRFDVFGVASATPSGLLEFPAGSPIYVFGIMGVLVMASGFVFSSIQSRDPRLRSYFSGLVPDRKTLALAIPVLLFFPVLLVSSNLLADMLGMSYDQPRYLAEPMSIWLPLMFVKLFTVAMLTGGNEEHGWRGVMLPLMQKTMSPLVATLIIVVIWEFWHLPLVFAGIYGEGSPWAILGVRILGMIPFAFLLTAIYNGSRGSIFLCIVFHACINSQINLFGGSMMANAVGLVLVIALIVVYRMWRRDSGYSPVAQQ
jgi:membrane protease YdiL (CAAX protease family)